MSKPHMSAEEIIRRFKALGRRQRERFLDRVLKTGQIKFEE